MSIKPGMYYMVIRASMSDICADLGVLERDAISIQCSVCKRTNIRFEVRPSNPNHTILQSESCVCPHGDIVRQFGLDKYSFKKEKEPR